MTPELIDLEFIHMELDDELRKQAEGGGKDFRDDDYDQYEEDAENFDSKLAEEFASEDESEEKVPAWQGDYDDFDEDDYEDVD